MRAGTLDIVVQTGAEWRRVIACMRPDDAIRVDAVTPGQRVFVDGAPLLVHAVTPAPGGRTTIAFGRGLIGDPVMTFLSSSFVAPAVPVELLAVEAAYAYVIHDDDTDEDLLIAVPIPGDIAGDGLSVTLALDADTTATMTDIPGSVSWDCYTLTAEWDWQRVLEGTLTTIQGDAR